MVADVKYYNGIGGLPVKAYKCMGTDVLELLAEIDFTNGDGNGSIYRIAKIPGNYVPVSVQINSEAVTSANDCDLGFYEPDEKGGAVISKDCLMNGGDLSSALAIGSEKNGLADLGVLNLGKTVRELLSRGIAERQEYTLALTANAGPTATKKAFLRIKFINAA